MLILLWGAVIARWGVGCSAGPGSHWRASVATEPLGFRLEGLWMPKSSLCFAFWFTLLRICGKEVEILQQFHVLIFFFKEFCWHLCNHKCHMFCSGFAFWLEMYRICHQLFLKINMISVKSAESQLETLSYY